MTQYKIQLTETAFNALQRLDIKTRKQIVNKIDDLQFEPMKRGKPLSANLRGYRSIRAAGQRYRIIYKVLEDRVIVIIVAVGIRKEGDKKDIYSLLKKYIDLNLLE